MTAPLAQTGATDAARGASELMWLLLLLVLMLLAAFVIIRVTWALFRGIGGPKAKREREEAPDAWTESGRRLRPPPADDDDDGAPPGTDRWT